jgi:hypothetical protein
VLPELSDTNARERVRVMRSLCGARRKYDGAPCEAKALPNGRCKLHGGLSTGPRTAEGRSRISAGVKAAWARRKTALDARPPSSDNSAPATAYAD